MEFGEKKTAISLSNDEHHQIVIWSLTSIREGTLPWTICWPGLYATTQPHRAHSEIPSETACQDTQLLIAYDLLAKKQTVGQ